MQTANARGPRLRRPVPVLKLLLTSSDGWCAVEIRQHSIDLASPLISAFTAKSESQGELGEGAMRKPIFATNALSGPFETIQNERSVRPSSNRRT
jgi:hypothetical protein